MYSGVVRGGRGFKTTEIRNVPALSHNGGNVRGLRNNPQRAVNGVQQPAITVTIPSPRVHHDGHPHAHHHPHHHAHPHPHPNAHSHHSHSYPHPQSSTFGHFSPAQIEQIKRETILVECLHKGTRVLGLLLEPKDSGNSWLVGLKNSEKVVIPKDDLLFEWNHIHMGQLFTYSYEDIARIEVICKENIKTYRDRLKIAWGSYVDKGIKAITAEVLANFLFGSNPKPHEIYSAYCILIEDDLYFSKEKIMCGSSRVLRVMYCFKCRSLKEVTEFESRKKEKLYYNQNLKFFLERVKKRLNQEEDAALSWDVKRDQIFIDKIKQIALSDNNQPTKGTTYSELLSPLGIGPKPFDAFQLLVNLGVWGKHENLNLHKFHRKLSFNESELKRAEEMVERCNSRKSPAWVCDQDVELRRDLTHIKPNFAIDDEKSTEVDDCISIETRDDGKTYVYIHIADPSRVVKPHDNLDLLARDRMCSIFVPEKHIPMFPPSLSEHLFSLLPHKTNYALTYIVQLDNEGQVASYEIIPSIIDQVNSVTYNKVDSVLSNCDSSSFDCTQEEISALHRLNQLAILRRKLRKQKGAVFLNIPVPEILIGKDGERIDIHPLYPESASRAMVAEYMILVGEITADFALKNKIPIPFRCQEKRNAPVEIERPELNEWIKDVLSQYDKRRQLLGAKLSVEPKPHSGLSLRAYCQASSPIRRYLDLIVHYQIKAFLRGEKLPFHKEAVMQLINDMEQPQQDINKLNAQSQRYWVLRYIENHSGELFKALILSIQTNFQQITQPKEPQTKTISHKQNEPENKYGFLHNMQVLLLDLGYEMGISLWRDSFPRRGDIIPLMLKSIDVFENSISFEEVIG
eukprot:TRINITY_DN7184_c0_g1_i1.p1 TRINITY_DN7184_c0_g1~~TRINITY_DN7184_c0_g1_i1.p1  ORF type:complete len:855 (+),score=143.74 TRINITY_DN7184_c0_g1_i1:94-2658(+)